MSLDVEHYYDSNTRDFLRLGGATGATGSLHRLLRFPGSRTAVDAINSIHPIILEQLTSFGGLPAEAARPVEDQSGRIGLIADLGCGVGASVEWMARNTAARVVGITISPVQAGIASTRLATLAKVESGSFLDRLAIERMTGSRALDAAFMIESFAHGTDPDELFRNVASKTRAGGLLIICDDFPSRRLCQPGADNHTWEGRRVCNLHEGPALNRTLLREFIDGWHIHTFLPVWEVAKLASEHGWILVNALDLSRYVVTNRVRDIAARVAAPFARTLRLRSSWWQNVRGGSALQRLIRRRLSCYQVVVFKLTAE